MSDANELEQKIIDDIVPIELKTYAESIEPLTLEEVFPGQAGVQTSLRERGIAKTQTRNGQDLFISADLDSEGRVVAMAAAVSRTPTRADKYLRDSVPDLSKTKDLTREKKIELFREIAKKEGILNNAIKKKASLVSQDGEFKVRSARQGKRPKDTVANELLTLLTFWQENVNSVDDGAAITGSRGLKQLIRRGTRQAMIEGDAFLRTEWVKVKVPQLSHKPFKLPMVLQSLPADEIIVHEELLGIAELYIWKPSGPKIRSLTMPKDPLVKKIINESFSSEVLNNLKKKRQHVLDPRLLVHIKHGGIDTEPYGESDVEAALTDIAYSRSLKQLDFVTIDSLLNRMLVIKIGDPNEKSAFHNQATAQKRVNVFNRLISEIGPNMMVVWAGHDIDKVDIGAHDKLLDTTPRQELAQAAVKLAGGVPDPVLTGTAEGGNAVAWAGFVALAAVAAEDQEEWAQALTQLAMRIASENKFKDVDVIWEFTHSLLADREANAKVFLQAYERGVISKRTLAEELDKDFDVERRRREQEKETGDEELFMPPPINQGGPGGVQGPGADSQPGRPKNKDTKKVGPERDRENKTL